MYMKIFINASDLHPSVFVDIVFSEDVGKKTTSKELQYENDLVRRFCPL
jgi:hypothetical protein